MKTFAMALVVTLASVASANAAGNVPKSTLAKLGLSDMQQVTDVQGMAIRGKGHHHHGGNSTIIAVNVNSTNKTFFNHTSQSIVIH